MKNTQIIPQSTYGKLVIISQGKKKTRKICTLSESYWFYQCLALDAIFSGLMARIAIEGGKGWPNKQRRLYFWF